jgi:hypothetical protein
MIKIVIDLTLTFHDLLHQSLLLYFQTTTSSKTVMHPTLSLRHVLKNLFKDLLGPISLQKNLPLLYHTYHLR